MLSNYYSTIEYRDKLYADLRVRARDTIILMCAILIASIGLNMNATAVIIGAMLISPLMTPIVGFGLGLAIYDTRLMRQSLTLLATQVGVSLLVSTLYFALSPISYASSELIARTSPTIWDILIALAGGVAGVIGSRQKEANNIVPGVAIATALMPPICTAGYGIATGQATFFFGAMYLFLINSVFIMLANFLGSRLLMNKSMGSSFKMLTRKGRLGIIVLILVLVIPASYSATRLALDYGRKDAISHFISDQLPDHSVIDKVYQKNKKVLELTVVGDHLTEQDLQYLVEQKSQYGLTDITLKINQLSDSSDLTGTNAKDLYRYIDKYIEKRLSDSSIKNEDIQDED